MAPQATPGTLSKQAPSRRTATLEAFAVWLVLSVIYLLTLAGNHTEAEDALRYLYDIRSGDASAISHPYHLAFGWYGWLAYQLSLAFGYSGGPLLPVQVLGAFTGALGIATLWVLLRTAAPGRVAAVAGCGLLAFSYGYWWYSVEVEVYILSTVLLICSLLLAYHAAINPSWKSFALLGATHGLAVLAHNTNVLFTTVVVAALLFASRSLPLRGVMRCALAYAGAGISVVVLAYMLAIAASGLKTPEGVYEWLTHAAQSDRHGTWEASSAPKAVIGSGRALVGGHFAFSLDPVREAVVGEFSGKSLREELFLVRDYPEALVLLLFVLLAVLALALLQPVLGWLRRPTLDGRAILLATLCIAWLVPYAVFFTWWEPHNIEFWIAPWVPLAILFALVFSRREYGSHRRLPPNLVVIIAVLLSINLLGSVWPQHSPEDDYWRMRTSWYERNTSAPDLVVTAGAQSSRYLRYFGSSRVIDIETVFPKYNDTAGALLALRRQIAEADAQRVLFSKEVFYPASDEFSRCTEAQLCDEWAPAMRDEFLPRTRIVADEQLETVRELNDD
jgi:hypothetical protein